MLKLGHSAEAYPGPPFRALGKPSERFLVYWLAQKPERRGMINLGFSIICEVTLCSV